MHQNEVIVNKTLATFGLALATLASSVALAAGPYPYSYRTAADNYSLYWGASAGEVLYSEDGLSTQAPTVALFRIGQKLSPNLAIEGRLGTGIRGDRQNGFHVNVQAIYGAYIKGILPLSPVVSAYGLAGLGGVQIHRNYTSANSNDAGISFGVGAEFDLGGGTALNLEWLRLTTGDNVGYGYSADQLTFGVNWRR
jgi:hypothetical protein